METLLVQPENKEQMKAIKAFLKALKIDFKAQKETHYKADWEAKMKRSEDDYNAGRVEQIKTADLWQ